jgi:hypothetical protein
MDLLFENYATIHILFHVSRIFSVEEARVSRIAKKLTQFNLGTIGELNLVNL